MRREFNNFWVPAAGADVAALTAQAQKVFPGNVLAPYRGYYKVAVAVGDQPPNGAIPDAVARNTFLAAPDAVDEILGAAIG